jgi:hypothetical protein
VLRSAILFLMVTLCSIPSTIDAKQASAMALLKKMRAACGGKNWDKVQGWSETGRVDLPGGMSAKHEAWSDMHTLKSASRATINGQQLRHVGFDGASTWSIARGGNIDWHNDPITVAKQRRDTYVSSFGYFFPNRFPAKFERIGQQVRAGNAYEILRVTPRNAESIDIWIDLRTSLVSRFEAGNESVELGEYRTFSGVCTATSGKQSDGDPSHDILLHVESVDTISVPASRFSPPGK